jgi:Tfp pilus assembly protein PilO
MSIEIRKITGESVSILICGIMVLLAAVLWRFGIVPQIAMLSTNRSNQILTKKLIEDEAGLNSVTGEIRDKNMRLQKRLDALSGNNGVKGAVTDDMPGNLEMLIACAKAADIRFVKLEPGQEKIERGLKRYPVTLQFTSTYHALGQFVNSVEKKPQSYSIDGLYVEARNDGRVEAKLGIICTVPEKRK